MDTTNIKGYVVMITGSREFTNKEVIDAQIANIPTPAIVMHGAARGADRLASEAIQSTPGLTEIRVPYINSAGKKGGYMRNQAMVELLKLYRDAGYWCWALAFHDDVKNPTPGTAGAIDLLTKGLFYICHIDGVTGEVTGSDTPAEA